MNQDMMKIKGIPKVNADLDRIQSKMYPKMTALERKRNHLANKIKKKINICKE